MRARNLVEFLNGGCFLAKKEGGALLADPRGSWHWQWLWL